MKYMEVINDLDNALNFVSTDELKAKTNKRVFNMCLTVLKEDFEVNVSTKFLMGFIEGSKKQKSNRVNYLLREIGLNTKKVTDCYFEKFPTMTTKDIEILSYKSNIDVNGEEQIYFKSIPVTVHDCNGIKKPSKVGIYSKKLKEVSLNQILI